jgi:hypothetical protein
MKTYTKTTIMEQPRLIIEYDNDADSPRTWHNLGYFVTSDGNYKSPDGTESDAYRAMMDTEDDATDIESHMTLIKEQLPNAIYITPVYRYEHGNVSYKRGTANGFDYSNCGFYIVMKDNDDGLTEKDTTKIEAIIDGELENYTNYVNGDVYQYTLYDEHGEIEESCSGFYDIEHIKQELPTEWKDEDLTEYLTN